MEEIWLPVVGYEGIYEVSNCGQIKSLGKDRSIKKCKFIRNQELILKKSVGKTGYYSVELRDINGFGKRIQVHRLVAKAFIVNAENKPCVNHKNGVKLDNSVNNLEWCTYSENSLHMHRTELYIWTEAQKKQCSELAKSQSKKVSMYDMNGNYIKTFESNAAAERAGFRPRNLRRGDTHSKGFIFY